MSGPVIAAMGGALLRGPDGWRWRDGRFEPRVYDVTALAAYELPRIIRILPEIGRVEMLSVSREQARTEPDLDAFVRAHASEVLSSPDDPEAIELPWALWERWAGATVVGVRWDVADEEGLLREAAAQQRR